MNGAEYRTLREVCGLSQQAAAEFHQVGPRTIQHWERERDLVPPGVAQEINELHERIEAAVAAAIARHTGSGADQQPVTLARYRAAEDYDATTADPPGLPFPAHGALIGRIKIALERLGVPVTVVWVA